MNRSLERAVPRTQLDMTAYSNGVNRVAIITDYVDTPLTAFVRLLVDEYSAYPWFDDPCGYACS